MSDIQNPTGVNPAQSSASNAASSQQSGTSAPGAAGATHASVSATGGATSVITQAQMHTAPGANMNGGTQTQAVSGVATGSNVQTQQAQAAAAGNANVAFKSAAIGNRENARTKDYFAEQNQETQTKKQEQSVRVRRTLIVGVGAISALVVAGLVWLLVIIFSQPKETSMTAPEEVKGIAEVTYDEALEKAGINNPEVEVGDAEEDVSAAEGVFRQAINDARASEDDALVSGLQERQRMTLL